MRYIIIIILLCFILIQPFALRAQEYLDNESNFFSFEKYQYTYLYFYRFKQASIVDAGLAQRRVHQLAKSFVAGFDSIGEEEIDIAISKFKKASSVLPEYFHSDFLVALSYEKKDDFKTAARFYKSYLKKLKKFHDGLFRLTQPLIESTVDFNIADYEGAYELISQRMTRYGIDIEQVSSRDFPFLFVFIIISLIVSSILYFVAKLDPVKRIVYKVRAKSIRSKDSWICLNCGQENANINIKCHRCGKSSK